MTLISEVPSRYLFGKDIKEYFGSKVWNDISGSLFWGIAFLSVLWLLGPLMTLEGIALSTQHNNEKLFATLVDFPSVKSHLLEDMTNNGTMEEHVSPIGSKEDHNIPLPAFGESFIKAVTASKMNNELDASAFFGIVTSNEKLIHHFDAFKIITHHNINTVSIRFYNQKDNEDYLVLDFKLKSFYWQVNQIHIGQSFF